MRRTFFFIVALLSATSSFASIPRAALLDRASEHAPAAADPLPETCVWASDVLAPFERPAESELTRALHQAYADLSTTNASGLGRFLSVDPFLDTAIALKNPQGWNRYAYVRNNPINKTDPTGKCEDPKPNSGGTRVCVQAFIPTPMFGAFVGDGRGPRSNGGTFRTNQSIMFNNQGKATAPKLEPGVSRLVAAPNVVARTAVVAAQGVKQVAPGVVQARGAASDGLAFGLAPNLAYNFTIGVDKNGSASVLGGKHTGYPAFEVWAYQDGKVPDLLYSYNPGRKDAFGGFFNISAVTVDVESQVPSLDPDVP